MIENTVKRIPAPLLLFIIGFIVALLPFFIIQHFSSAKSKLKDAYENYISGEKAETIAERQNAFNKALTLYSQLETEYQPYYGNGKLFYDIANTYFQLGQYPRAVYYYNQALVLMPRNEAVKQNLKVALTKLNLTPASDDSIFRSIFFFHYLLSLPERFEAFFFLGCLVIGFLSAYIWKKINWIKNCLIVFSLLCCIFLLSILYSIYLSPIEGVVIRSTSLYRDAGYQYAKVQEEPVLAGSKVEVLGVPEDGKWLKILSSDGTLGFIPGESIKIIKS